jgi:hypothetical protein
VVVSSRASAQGTTECCRLPLPCVLPSAVAREELGTETRRRLHPDDVEPPPAYMSFSLNTTGGVASRFVSQKDLDEAKATKDKEWTEAYARCVRLVFVGRGRPTPRPSEGIARSHWLTPSPPLPLA